MSAPERIILNSTRMVIELIDGTPEAAGPPETEPVVIALGSDSGNFNCGPLKRVLIESDPVERKGRHYGDAPGARIYPAGSFDGILGLLSDAAAGDFVAYMLGAAPYEDVIGTYGPHHHNQSMRHIRVTWVNPAGDNQVLYLEHCDITIDELASAAPTNTYAGSYVCKGDVYFNGVKVASELAADTLEVEEG